MTSSNENENPPNAPEPASLRSDDTVASQGETTAAERSRVTPDLDAVTLAVQRLVAEIASTQPPLLESRATGSAVACEDDEEDDDEIFVAWYCTRHRSLARYRQAVRRDRLEPH